MNIKHLIPFSALAMATVLAGCSGNGSNAPTGPGVRVVNGISTVSQADVTVGTIVVSNPLPYATVSGTPAHPYAIIPLGDQSLNLANVSAPATSVVSTTINLTVQQNLNEIAYLGAGGTPTFLPLYDSLAIPVDPMIRLVNASQATGNVDLVFRPPASSSFKVTLNPGTVSPIQGLPQEGSYTDLPISGAYNLKLYPAGADTGTPIVNETVNLPTGVSWTFIVLDPPTGQTVPIILQVQDNQLHDTAP